MSCKKLMALVCFTLFMFNCGGSSSDCYNCDLAVDESTPGKNLEGGWLSDEGVVLEIFTDTNSYYLSNGPERELGEYEYGTYIVEGSIITFTVEENLDGDEGFGINPGDSMKFTFLVSVASGTLTLMHEDLGRISLIMMVQ